jgi:hypothetical protein
MDCINVSSGHSSSTQTAAGFPSNKVEVNASTWYMGIFFMGRRILFFIKTTALAFQSFVLPGSNHGKIINFRMCNMHV